MTADAELGPQQRALGAKHGALRGGQAASKRMHEQLQAQQRRKEEFWLKKYGKLLTGPEQRAKAGSRLPLLAGQLRHGSGQPPTNLAQQPQPDHDMQGDASTGQLPHLRSHGPPLGGGRPSGQPAPLTNEWSQASHVSSEHSKASVRSAIRIPGKLQPLSAGSDKRFHAAPLLNAGQPSHGRPVVPEPSSLDVGGGAGGAAAGNNQLRDLEFELAVRKAIKAREDTLDRLRVACEKLDAFLGGSVPVVLPPTDPLVRLLFRLVGQLRLRTLDCVEALAAWHRRHNTNEPFLYYGAPYLKGMGPDLAFLDRQPFLKGRLRDCSAAEDPFLPHLTQDGVPIEEATALDLRRGGHRFTSEALRIRVARKVLAMYCGRRGVGSGALGATSPALGSRPADGLESVSSSSLSSMHDEAVEPEEDMPLGLDIQPDEPEESLPRPLPGGPSPQLVPLLPLAHILHPERLQGTLGDGATCAVEMTGFQDTASVASDMSDVRPVLGGSASPQRDDEGRASQPDVVLPAAERSFDFGPVSTTQTAEEVSSMDGQEVVDVPMAERGGNSSRSLPPDNSLAVDSGPQQLLKGSLCAHSEAAGLSEVAATETPFHGTALQGDVESIQIEGGAEGVDYVLEAILASLEEPYASQLPGGAPFKVADWEVDQVLDGVLEDVANAAAPRPKPPATQVDAAGAVDAVVEELLRFVESSAVLSSP